MKNRKLTLEESQKFNSLFEKASSKQRELIFTGNYSKERLGYFSKLKLKKSIRLFKECLIMDPNHWQSKFLMAKAYQRLGNHLKSLELFEKAFEIDYKNHLICKEASMEAMQLSEFDKALFYSSESTKLKEDDITLIGNHALNLLIIGEDELALKTILKALEKDPNDKINLTISQLVNKVINGEAKRPTLKGRRK